MKVDARGPGPLLDTCLLSAWRGHILGVPLRTFFRHHHHHLATQTGGSPEAKTAMRDAWAAHAYGTCNGNVNHV